MVGGGDTQTGYYTGQAKLMGNFTIQLCIDFQLAVCLFVEAKSVHLKTTQAFVNV